MSLRRLGLFALALPLLLGAPLVAPAGEEGAGDAVVNSLGMRMVLVPAGTFRMGSPPGEARRQADESPRNVTLTRPIRMAATEGTQAQWLALMPANRSRVQGDDLPVTSISWKDAVEFCSRLSEKEGETYRLPTEAEWEHACRAGATGPLDDAVRDETAWWSRNSGGKPHPGGLKAPNAWGLYDLLGNAAEWTADAYGPYEGTEATDPTGPAEGGVRVVRGGAYRSFVPAVRCAARVGTPPSHQQPHVGLRVVMEVR